MTEANRKPSPARPSAAAKATADSPERPAPAPAATPAKAPARGKAQAKAAAQGSAAARTPVPALVLPGAEVKVVDPCSIYRGYTGIVQRVSGQRAAVLFEGGNWDKLVTMPRSQLRPEPA